MRAIRIGFAVAAAYGLIATLSLYAGPALGADTLMRYAFAGAAAATQLAYLLIARDPIRYRMLIPVGIASKISFAVPAALVATRTGADGLLAAAALDLLLATFFAIAFVTIGRQAR